jgi:hypothetical protein
VAIMSGWLPPGVTDADIDRACPGYDDELDKGDDMSEFDPDAVSKRLSGLEFDCRVALDRFMEASPWLARQLLEDYMERLGSSPRRFPSVHRVVT